MSQNRIAFNTNTEDKKAFQDLAASFGLSISTALNMIIKSSVREQRIPVDLSLESKAERAEINRVLDSRQKIVDSGKAEWYSGEQVKDIVGLKE